MKRQIALRRWSLAAIALAALLHRPTEAATTPAPLPETATGVGYDTVAAALAAVRSKSGVILSVENGWLIATDEAEYTIWSFAPQGYSAYPAVVKRQVTARKTGSRITMSVLCEASKQECDALVRTFAEMTGVQVPQ